VLFKIASQYAVLGVQSPIMSLPTILMEERRARSATFDQTNDTGAGVLKEEAKSEL
jgi:hypothetical protein